MERSFLLKMKKGSKNNWSIFARGMGGKNFHAHKGTVNVRQKTFIIGYDKDGKAITKTISIKIK